MWNLQHDWNLLLLFKKKPPPTWTGLDPQKASAAVFKCSVISAKRSCTYINKSTARVASTATSTLSNFHFTAFWIARLSISAFVRVKLCHTEAAASLLLNHKYLHYARQKHLLEKQQNSITNNTTAHQERGNLGNGYEKGQHLFPLFWLSDDCMSWNPPVSY